VRIPFGVRLGIVISLLSVGMTTGSVLYFYSTTYRLVLAQMTGRLRDVGKTGAFLLDAEARDRLVQLKLDLAQSAQISSTVLASMEPGGTLNSLSPEQVKLFQARPDVQQLTQILRQINQASRQQIQPLQSHYPQIMVGGADSDPPLISAYLLVKVAESPDGSVLQFLASDLPEPQGDWPGNPIGQLYKPNTPVYQQAFSGQAQTSQEFNTDEFYTFVSAAIPLKNAQGEVIAVLGLDYIAGTEADRIRTLGYICLGIVLASVVLSVVLAIGIARWLGRPIAQLRDGAEQVRDRNFDFTIKVHSNDELGLLAETFNAMVADIRNYSQALEAQNEVLEARVADRTKALEAEQVKLQQANAQITELNQKLKAENLRMSAQLEVARQLQQMILPREEELQHVPELEIAAGMDAADEVCGDYYDVLAHKGRLKIGIGDVSGHGLESGVVMMMAQTAIRTLQAMNVTDPVHFLNTLNQVLYTNTSRMRSYKYMTLALLDYDRGILRLSGQHEDLIVVRHSGEIEPIDTIDLGFPLGIEADITPFIQQVEIKLQPGDIAVMYTDGITEATNADRALYGLERFYAILQAYRHESAEVIRQSVLADVKQHIGCQRLLDDITLIVVKQGLVP